MRERVRNVVAIARAVVDIARRSQLPFLAAAVSYYAFLSFLPLLALALVASTAIGGPNVVDLILGRFEAVITPDTEQLLRDALGSGSGRLGVSVAGTFVVVWSALKVLRALDVAFSTVYGTHHGPSIPGSVLNAVVVLVGVPVGVALTAAVPVAVRFVPLGAFERVAIQAGGIVALIAVFLPMYVVFPNARISVRGALPGAALAATGWSLLGAAFSLYVAVAGRAPLYGPLGGLVLLLTVLYAGASLLLLGAVLNAVLAGVRASEVERLGSGPERDRVDREVARRDRLHGRGEREVDEDDPELDREPAPFPDRQLQQATDRQPGVARTMPEDAHERHGSSDERVDSRDGDRTVRDVDGTVRGDEGDSGDGGDDGEDGDGDDDGHGGDDGRTGRVGTDAAEFDPAGRAPPEELLEEVRSLRAELDAVRDDVEDRTVHRDSVERDLRRYVRRRIRRGHARGWGPYLVLLYGTAMTIAAFSLLSDGLAVVAMVVIWLSTLGLYVLLVLFGASIELLGVPGRLRDAIGDWRS